MLAIELSTSIDWAREMRGTASMASTVIGRLASASTSSGFERRAEQADQGRRRRAAGAISSLRRAR